MMTFLREYQSQHIELDNIIIRVKHKRARCDIRENDIHRASCSRRLKSNKHLENIQQNKVIPPEKIQQKEM